MLDIDEHFELWQPPPELVDRDKLPGMPRQGIGRAMKVSKEQIVALLTALKLFGDGTYDGEPAAQAKRLQRIAESLAGTAARCRLLESAPECLPLLEIAVDEQKLGRTAIASLRSAAGRLAALLRGTLGPR